MFNKNIWSKFTILAVLLFLSVWFFTNSFASNEQRYLKLDKGLFYLKQVYETISRNYVDNVDPEGLSKSAIQGIVEELDPYTVFFEKKGSENLEIITKGKYGGLGMEIGKREGNITIISPIDDTPAQKAGLKAGDVIIKIDNNPTSEMSLEDASSRLRGKVGTDVTIEIQRPGVDDSITLRLTREEIVIKDVSFANFIEPGTAIFRLNSFSDKASSELRQAVVQLQKEGEIERAILDLRGNPGGLLASAVEVANIFIPKNELIVKTRGTHEREAEYLTTASAMLPDIPIIVLVDGGSASASEIVAGAVQDLDRGVVLGSKTFGKGLVQQVYPVDKVNDAFIKITTAKYYIPSGRCIQREDYKKNKDVFSDITDSTEFDNHKKYFTKNGRIVYGGGGISPDVDVESYTPNYYITALWASGHFFNFTVDYLAKHPDFKPDNGATVSDDILSDFQNYLSENEVIFDIEGEKELEDFLAIAEEVQYNEDVIELVNIALEKLDKEKSVQFEQNEDKIREYLELEFAEKLDGSSARFATLLKYDKTVDKALEILHSLDNYQQILAISN
jgi:carboxyl-terminal processing protease